MPNPYPRELRVRAVRAYESRTEPYPVIAARFEIGPATLMRWVQRQRETGTVDPLAKGGGWVSPVAWAVLKPLIDAKPDQTCEELTRAYNRVAPYGRVHRSSIWRALPPDRVCLQKKRSRPAEQDRARVQAERAAFRVWAQTIEAERLVFLDESGANVAMGRSHAWLPRGQELIEPRPRNWGDNLSLVGAMRLDGWVTLATAWGAMTTPRFVAWVRRHLVRQLRPGDIVVLDNLAAHKAPGVRALIEAAGGYHQIPPALLLRLQSDRAGLGLGQEAHSRRGAPDGRAAAMHGPTGPARHSATTLSELVQSCGLSSQLISGVRLIEAPSFGGPGGRCRSARGDRRPL